MFNSLSPTNAFKLTTFCLLCHAATAQPLTITEPIPLEMPELGPRYPSNYSYPAVGVTGTNALFVWNQPGPDDQWNIFFSRLDQNGVPLDNPGRFLASRQFSSGATTLLPAGSSFFMIYDRIIDPGHSELLVSRIGVNGNQLFDPLVLTTNVSFAVTTNIIKPHRAASNGRTLMVVYGGAPETNALIYTLVSGNGAIFANGALEGSAYPTSYDLASDGKDYLLAWQTQPTPLVHTTRFDGATAAYTTISITPTNYSINALGYGKNGYLLATSAKSPSDYTFLQLDRDGNTLAQAKNSYQVRSNSAIFGEGEDWVVFITSVFGSAGSFRVTPANGTLNFKSAVYTTGDVFYSPDLPPEAVVQRFGPARYLVAKNRGVSVLTTNGATPTLAPKAYATQKNGCVVASPTGYLVAWTEKSGSAVTLRALRLNRDGSHLDAHSFPIVQKITDAPICVFDSVDYIVGWLQQPELSTHVARISPTGDPNIRTADFTSFTGARPFNMVVNQGALYLFTIAGDSPPNLHLFTTTPAGDVTSETLLHGQMVVSDGTNLSSVGSENGVIYTWLVQPAASPAESNQRIFVTGNNAYGESLRGGFAVSWSNQANNQAQWSYAYFTNRSIKYRSKTSLPNPPILAASSDHLLAAARSNSNAHDVLFQSLHLATGQIVSAEADLGPTESFDLDSAGRDFLGVTDSANVEMNFIGQFWVTPTARPALPAPHLAADQLQSTINLDPARAYRIETSDDMVNWRLIEVVSGRSSFDIVDSTTGAHAFFRVTLLTD